MEEGVEEVWDAELVMDDEFAEEDADDVEAELEEADVLIVEEVTLPVEVAVDEDIDAVLVLVLEMVKGGV